MGHWNGDFMAATILATEHRAEHKMEHVPIIVKFSLVGVKRRGQVPLKVNNF